MEHSIAINSCHSVTCRDSFTAHPSFLLLDISICILMIVIPAKFDYGTFCFNPVPIYMYRKSVVNFCYLNQWYVALWTVVFIWSFYYKHVLFKLWKKQSLHLHATSVNQWTFMAISLNNWSYAYCAYVYDGGHPKLSLIQRYLYMYCISHVVWWRSLCSLWHVLPNI